MIPDNAQDFSRYIGIPYADTNTPVPGGLNCWQLVEKVMIEVFHMKPPVIDYKGPLDACAPVFMSHMKIWDQVEKEDRQPGDVVVLRVVGYPIHCGILVKPDLFLHTLKNHNSAVEQLNSLTWRKRIVGIYRWNEKQL